MESKIDQIAASYIRLIPLLYRKLDHPNKSAAAGKTASDLTHLQLHILEELFNLKTAITITQLAKRIRISKQQLTPLISKLEEHHYIMKIPDPDDKRSIRLELTEPGENIVNQRWGALHQQLCGQLSRLGEEDLTDLHFAIAKIEKIVGRME